MLRPSWIGVCCVVWGFAACGGESDKTTFVPNPKGAGSGSGGSKSGAGGEGASGVAGGESGAGHHDGGAGTGPRGGNGGRGVGKAGAGGKSGRAGTSGAGGTSGEVQCPAGGEGGDASRAGKVCPSESGNGRECDVLDCVADCTSAEIVRGEPDGCGVRCPPEAPIPASDCMQSCDRHEIFCGPGLYCNIENDVYTSYSEACANEGLQCGCSFIPPSCAPPDESDGVWICARDHQTYPSICEAHRARTEIVAYTDDASCAPPSDDVYACGGIFCRKGIDECGGTDPLDDHDHETYACIPAGGAGGESGSAGAGH